MNSLTSHTSQTSHPDAQSVGDLVGRAFQIYRANITQWFRFLLFPTIFVLVSRIMVQSATAFMSAEKSSPLLVSIVVVLFGAACLTLLVARWLLLLRQLALVRIVNGLSSDLKDALKVVSGRQGALIAIGAFLVLMVSVTSVIFFLFVILCAFLFKRGSPLSFIPILLVYGSMFGWFISLGFIHASGFLISCAAVCEKQRISQVIGRGFSLSGRAFFRTLLGGFLIMITIVLLGPPLWLPVFVFCALDAFRMGFEGSGNSLPFHWQVLWSTWESLVDMVVWPICFIFFGLYYADMKVRQEGQDLSDNLAKLKTEYQSLLDGEVGSTA